MAASEDLRSRDVTEVYGSQNPEQKLSLVRGEAQKANTVFMGDGNNDAPALTANNRWERLQPR